MLGNMKMTSKEAIKWLDAIINDSKAMFGNEEDNNKALNIIKKDLEVLEILKNALTIEPKPLVYEEIKPGMPISEYIGLITKNEIDNKLKEQLTQWIIENIDKDKIKEWLDNDIKYKSK